MKTKGIVLHPLSDSQLDNYLKYPSHAVLFSGPKGSGKTHVAISLAQSLLSVDQSVVHPYFRTISPENDSISIMQIRELIRFFRLKVPGTQKIKRVAILEDAESMGLDAQNALLKMLEEPPEDSVLILTSSRPQSLLPTIRSRTQHMQLTVPDVDKLIEHFKNQGYEESDIRNALLRTGTNISEAKHLLDGGIKQTNTVIDLAKKALSVNSYDRMVMVDSLSKRKEAANEFVNTLAIISVAGLKSAAEKGSSSMDKWQTILGAVHTAQEALARNANVKLVLTELMLVL